MKFKILNGYPLRVFLEDGQELGNILRAELKSEPEWDYWPLGTITDRLRPPDRWVPTKLTLEIEHPEVEVVDDPPPSLTARLRALAAKWCKSSTGPSADRENIAAETARETCAEELEELLDQLRQA